MSDNRPGYTLVMRFATSRDATRAFMGVMAILSGAEQSELSAFRLEVDGVATVVVIGDPPEPDLHENLIAALESGESTVVPAAVMRVLHRRRAEQTRLAPWVERHHRPGLRVRVEE